MQFFSVNELAMYSFFEQIKLGKTQVAIEKSRKVNIIFNFNV